MSTRTESIFGKLQDDGYRISQLSYPQDLSAESSGNGHFILFNINVTKGSRIDTLKKSTPSDATIPNTPTVESAPVTGGGTLRSEASELGIYSGKVTRRIDTAIGLYMPDDITTSYATNWEGGELSAPIAMMKTINGATDMIKNFDANTLGDFFNSAANGGAASAGSKAINYGLDFMNANLGGTELGNAASILKREFRNPYMEFLFKGVSARSFNLNFKFSPRSQIETNRVRDIIHKFKYHQLPEYNRDNALGVFYTYPSEFDITFFSNTTENKYLFKMSTCALTECRINYTGAGQWSAFREIDGEGAAPTHIEMSLTFTELELLSRQRISQGF
jgi:hypothetical protein